MIEPPTSGTVGLGCLSIELGVFVDVLLGRVVGRRAAHLGEGGGEGEGEGLGLGVRVKGEGEGEDKREREREREGWDEGMRDGMEGNGWGEG